MSDLAPGPALWEACKFGLDQQKVLLKDWCSRHETTRQCARFYVLGTRNGTVAQRIRQALVRDSQAEKWLPLFKQAPDAA